MGIGFLARPWFTADRRLQFGHNDQLMRELWMDFSIT